MKKNYSKFICIACIAVFVSGCSINGSKTSSNNSNAKDDKQIVHNDHLEGSSDEDEITSEAPGFHEGEIASEVPGSNHSNQTEENPGQNTITTQEKPTAKPEEKEIKSATGYVLDTIGNIIYVDLENPGDRNYPGEGKDRGVAFDITNATITQAQELDGYDGTLSNNPIRSSVTVDILYYVEGDTNIVTSIYSDNIEKQPINYVSIGVVNSIDENKITVDITEGDQSGAMAVFDFSSSMDSIYGIAVNDKISITYYVKGTDNMVMSYYKPES